MMSEVVSNQVQPYFLLQYARMCMLLFLEASQEGEKWKVLSLQISGLHRLTSLQPIFDDITHIRGIVYMFPIRLAT